MNQHPITEIVDPATGEAFTTVPKLPGSEAASLVSSAVSAQISWAETPLPQRAKIIRAVADQLRKTAKGLTEDLAREGGKVASEAVGEVEKSIDTFHYYAGLAGGLDGRTFSGGRAGLRHETRTEPVGVVLAITPWNVPLASPARKIAPALLAGNSIILKPAEQTPLSSLNLKDALDRTGAPPFLIQVATGSGRDLGDALVSSEQIGAVSFTGSTEVGMRIRRKLADRMTRVQLELGGKNAAIVLPDADLENAVKWIIAGAFTGAGQQCTGTSRVIVHRDVEHDFLDLFVSAVDDLIADAKSPNPRAVGPLIDQAHRDAVHGYVIRAKENGATILRGGSPVARPGYYYLPTVVTGSERVSEINTEEVFGPVVSVIVADDLEDAISIGNATKYGLSASVHTRDFGAAERVASATEAGVVAVNGSTSGIELAAPFGGFKLSGTDSKEHGPESLRFYTRSKLVSWGQP